MNFTKSATLWTTFTDGEMEPANVVFAPNTIGGNGGARICTHTVGLHSLY